MVRALSVRFMMVTAAESESLITVLVVVLASLTVTRVVAPVPASVTVAKPVPAPAGAPSAVSRAVPVLVKLRLVKAVSVLAPPFRTKFTAAELLSLNDSDVVVLVASRLNTDAPAAESTMEMPPAIASVNDTVFVLVELPARVSDANLMSVKA